MQSAFHTARPTHARLLQLVCAALLALPVGVGRAEGVPSAPAPEPALPPATRLVVALRVGLEAGFGRAEQTEVSHADMSDYAPLTLPIGLSVLAQWRSGLELGGGFALAPGFAHAVGDAPATDGARARSLGVRTGLEIARHFRPNSKMDPWLGAGLGGELLRYSTSVGERCWSNGDCYRVVDVKARYRALPELSMALGIDLGRDTFRVGPMMRFGAASFGRVHRSYTADDPEYGHGRQHDAYDLDHARVWHAYLFVGVRGSYRR